MYRTSNKLSENIRCKSAEVLNPHLAAAIDLHAQIKQAHWNVCGPAFIAIHELLDKVADVVEGYSDTIAARGDAGQLSRGNDRGGRQAVVSRPVRARGRQREDTLDGRDGSARHLRRLRPQSDRRRLSATRTLPMFLPRCRAASIAKPGWSSRICTRN